MVKYFSEKALEAILKQPNANTIKGVRDLFYMILMYDTGARNQEILDLMVKDVHTKSKDRYVALTGKGNKCRVVPLMEKTIEHFNNYIKLFHKNDSYSDQYLFYVFSNGTKHQMSDDNVSRFLKIYGTAAQKLCTEVPNNLHAHLFRHSRSIHLYRSGMPLALLSEWLGHEQIETTMMYYADTEMKRVAIEKATDANHPLRNMRSSEVIELDDDTIKRLYGLK